ncbi:Small basic protein [Abditibacterium utsteinense]|uniref:Small basic protein n=1 Tax=Abditibacterium utsteinense TaxID=1960156 RepID=A0A2S8SSI2_9BACT|nr:small basic family protein [Abditibacterium utsteinense]PQV63772.1 Small basic protein [Abditibacterium utsteinense]
MFALPLLAIALGFILVYLPGNLFPANEALARYTAVAVLAGLDTVLGGIRAWLDDKFDDAIFISGFFTNALLAVGLVVLGEKLGLETGIGDGRISVMMIGAVVVFSGRILNNLAALRRLLIERVRARKFSVTAGENSRETPPVLEAN